MFAETKLRVIVYHDATQWVAHCLEYAISAQAATLEELQSRFETTLGLDLAESIKRGGAPFAGIPPAPAFVARLWEKRDSGFRAELNLPEQNIHAELAIAA